MNGISMGGMTNMGGMGGMKGAGPMGKPPTAATLMKKMDQNADGYLEVSEAKGPLAEQFATSDSDSDGKISSEELQSAMETFQSQMKAKIGTGQGAHGPHGPPPSAQDLISRMDQDEDGAIGVDEADGLLAERFDAADTNKDGKVSLEELQADIKSVQAEGMPPPGTMGAGGPNGSSTSAQSLLDAMDQDGDGQVGSDELQRVLDAMKSGGQSGSGSSVSSDLADAATPFGLVQYMLAATTQRHHNDESHTSSLSLTA
ncbi:MAG: EF-hand domain-containing protein [Magnetococcales bacterium]|nr:EF-hand domain-containing protein [Magnetococcales bacterium]